MLRHCTSFTGEVGRWYMLPGTERVKDCDSFKASAHCKRSLKTSWAPQFIIHYSLSFIPTGKSSYNIKHSYILSRHKQNNSLPCPEIALFFPVILRAFISEARFALKAIVFSEQVRYWFELLTHTFMKHRGSGELLEILWTELCLQLCQKNSAQVSLYVFTAWWVIMGQG